MVHTEGDTSWILNTRDRMLAMAAYTRTFFKAVSADEFSRMLEDARVLGQQWLIERLYTKQVIRNIVKKVIGRIDRAYLGKDQLDDYTHDATVVLMQIAGQGRFDLSKSAGEIACYTCLWIEQRIKRIAKKDLRWQSSLSETGDDPEVCVHNSEIEELCVFDRCLDNKGNADGASGLEGNDSQTARAGARDCPPGGNKKNRVATYVMQKNNSYISSLFNSKRTTGRAG